MLGAHSLLPGISSEPGDCPIDDPPALLHDEAALIGGPVMMATRIDVAAPTLSPR